jgi:7-keto-8-aminopelargonate synthetase-like enzyme
MSAPLLKSPPGPVTKIDGREYLYFVGTGYLGLQGHPEVIRAACEAAQQYGIGSANSRTAFGTTEPVLHVERAAAAMFGLDDAFYFASGWMGANILIQSLDWNHRLAFVDESAHYSLVEAVRASGCLSETFHHRDADDLRAKLKKHLKPGNSPLVLSDGVFAATGRIAPVEAYCNILCDYPGSIFYLDDAHGLAVLGENGRGTFEHAGVWSSTSGQELVASGQWPVARESEIRNLKSEIVESPPSALRLPPSSNPQSLIPNSLSVPLPCPALLFSGTLSKAVGGYGGIIPGSREFINHLKSQSPYFGGASAPPTPIAAATARAIELITADPSLRTRLWSNVRFLKTGLRRIGFDVDDTPVPIVCLEVGVAENMKRIQSELMARGIAIAYMAAYSGLGPEGGLRLAVFATHTEEMIERLLDELQAVI